MSIQHLRSSTANKRPTPAAMADGQIAVNTEATSPGLFFKNASGDLVKVGPVHVGTTAPNASPAAGGQTGNTLGEQWLDTTGGTYVFKVWDGSAWRSETGTFVDVNGDTMTGALGIIAGSASTPGLFISGDTNTGIYSPGADQLAISTNGTQRLLIDSSGNVNIDSNTLYVDATNNRVGLGTSSPGAGLHLVSAGQTTAALNTTGSLNLLVTDTGGLSNNGGSIVFGANSGAWRFASIKGLATNGADNTTGDLAFSTRNTATDSTLTERLRITSTGNVGIGSNLPNQLLHINSSAASGGQLQITNASTGTTSTDGLLIGYDGSNDVLINNQEATALKVNVNGSERARIDSSGRLLVGTSTARANYANNASIQQEGTDGDTSALQLLRNSADGGGALLYLGKTRSASIGGTTVVQNADDVGRIRFIGSDGTTLRPTAEIVSSVDGTPGANDMPGRLVFSTTADGASSPTERFRIGQNGHSVFYNTGFVYPATDNATNLGGSTNRWANVYAANGTIQTSDERAKTDIADAQLGINFIKSLRPVSYKWIDGGKQHTGEYDDDSNWVYETVPGQRTHWGFIAQEVKEAVDAAGVDFGGWVLTDKDDPDSQQALRYDQFVAPLTKALQEALAKIETLEAKVAALEAS